jgi:nicotinate phosphoribosyltransferase
MPDDSIINEDQTLTVTPEDYSLLTDLYQLTMSACYVGEELDQRTASFELTVRRLPEGFGYLIAMGLAQVVDYLQHLKFAPEQVDYLRSLTLFNHAPASFWTLLSNAKFTGDLWAVPEGTAIFPNQPLLRVEAPLWQAQLVETYVLNTINYQTLVATRVARLRDLVGPEVKLLEFGTRRAFSPQASVWAARAALAAGFDATSNVLAACKLGRTPSGTMAHALVMALAATEGDERRAFTAFGRYFPHAALLIDTYDAIAAAQDLAQMQQQGEIELGGVRIDSGDLAQLAKELRQILPGVPILASGDLDELEIERLQTLGAGIDGYGLGTKLVTGAPVNGVYKLVEIDGIPVMKESSGKRTYPGRKQVFRYYREGQVLRDCLGLAGEAQPEAESLLQSVIKQGTLVAPPESLAAIAHRTASSVASLPLATRRLQQPNPPVVEISADLLTLTEQTRRHPAIPIHP